MTNSEKIKAYLDAGHKVRVDREKTISSRIVYGYDEDGFMTKSGVVGFDFFNFDNVSIQQEPLRYPTEGYKVVDVRDGKVYTVMINKVYCFCHNGGEERFALDYRNLAPYIG